MRFEIVFSVWVKLNVNVRDGVTASIWVLFRVMFRIRICVMG